MAWSIEVRRDREAFVELADWWNQCPGPQASPFLRSEWFALWADAFSPSNSRLELVVVTSDGYPKAVLPLMSNGWRRASLSNSHSDVFDVISDSDAATQVVADWLRRRPMTRLYRLDGLSALDIPNAGSQVAQSSESPFADLTGGIDGLRVGMGQNLKKNIGRLERRLAEMGEITYLDNADGELPDALDVGLQLEASGWKGEGGSAMLSRPDTEMFYRGLFELARNQGWLRLSALLLAGQLVACQFSIDYGGRRFLLKPAYDEGLGAHSPGKVLQWKVLQTAIASGLESYEFGGEAERWKMEWTNTVRPRDTILQFATSGFGKAIGRPLQSWAGQRRGAHAAE